MYTYLVDIEDMKILIERNTLLKLLKESTLDDFLKKQQKQNLNNLVGKYMDLVIMIQRTRINLNTGKLEKNYKKKLVEGRIEEILPWDLYSVPKIVFKTDKKVYQIVYDEKQNEFKTMEITEKHHIEPYTKSDQIKLEQFKKFFYSEDPYEFQSDIQEKWSEKYKKSIN